MLSDTQAESLVWAGKMKRLVFSQLLVLLIVAVVVAVFFGGLAGGSFLAGGLLICLNAWFMANALSLTDASLKLVYRSAVLRYIGVFLVLFLLAVVGADLLVVCIGMFVVYLAGYVFSVKGVLASGRGL